MMDNKIQGLRQLLEDRVVKHVFHSKRFISDPDSNAIDINEVTWTLHRFGSNPYY